MIISDTTLHDNLTFNLRPIQERHKQVCGSTLCTVMEEYHRSLRKYCLNLVEHLIGVDKTRADRYKAEVFPSGTELKERESHVRNQIMRSLPDGSVHHKWICFMGRCESYPDYNIPKEEKESFANPLQIHFQTYKEISKCTIHGILNEGLSTWPTCIASLQVEGAKTGKVTIRDRLTDMRTSIVTFHVEYYEPMLLKYKYHYGLVQMVSKNQCFEPRKNTFKADACDIMTRRDSAERLLGENRKYTPTKLHKKCKSRAVVYAQFKNNNQPYDRAPEGRAATLRQICHRQDVELNLPFGGSSRPGSG